MNEAVAAEPSMVIIMIQLTLVIVSIVALWKLFSKAGKPGWASIVPIYNSCVMLDIAGKPMWWMPMWWILLMFIPVVNLVISVLMLIGLAKNFGRGTGTVIGLIFLPFIFLLILAFGSAEYEPIS